MKKLLLTIISSLALGGMATAQQTDAAVAAADTATEENNIAAA